MPASQQFVLDPADNERLANLCGPLNEHLRQVEQGFDVEVTNRGAAFTVRGVAASLPLAERTIRQLYDITLNLALTPEQVHLAIREIREPSLDLGVVEVEEVVINTKRGQIRGRGPNQKRYLAQVVHSDLTFGVGPAGTGKTYLAVACAVRCLEYGEVKRIILTRPAVEAGERLGFLPGDMSQKIDPYLRPLYDALNEMLGMDRVARLIERNVIEIAPLAFMRGRTLNDAFVILDEAQNTTVEQMKMFLTRLGHNSKAVVTGDRSQVDLPRNQTSGLRHALHVLEGVEGISMSHFKARDVVRHPLVQKIVEAYDAFDAGSNSPNG